MKINEIISKLRGLLKAYSDETDFTDAYLWSLFCLSRSEILSNKLKRYNFINPSNYKTICLEMEKANAYECGCIELDCTVYKSKNKISDVISGRNISSLKVYPLLNNKEIDYVDELEIDIYMQDDIFKNKPLYSIINKHIVLYNKNYPVIQVRAIWGDILKLNEIQYCSDSVECLDYFNDDIGMSKEDVSKSIKMMFKDYLNILIKLPEDNTNDINETIKI
mgnify:CR=1 FL=1